MMSLCPEAEFRASLDDGEFWDYVLNGVRPGQEPEVDFSDEDQSPPDEYGGPCDVCGERGPCGYDAEGRPLIHPTYVRDDEEDSMAPIPIDTTLTTQDAVAACDVTTKGAEGHA